MSTFTTKLNFTVSTKSSENIFEMCTNLRGKEVRIMRSLVCILSVEMVGGLLHSRNGFVRFLGANFGF